MYALKEYQDIMENYLAIPVIVGVKTDSEKFPGAEYTTALEAMMPDGKALQMGTSHNLGQHFAKMFDIKYIGEDKQDHLVWQTSWGITTRTIGALTMIHGDDKGLVLPPKVAPVQVVIVPIPFKGAEPEAISAKAQQYADLLTQRGLTVIFDDRQEYTPGWKFNQYELKGVPLRIEIGPRDLKQGSVVMVRRDTKEKSFVKEADVPAEVDRLLNEIQHNLYVKAKQQMESMMSTVQTYDELKQVIAGKGGFVKAAWCGSANCEAKVKEETGATIRVRPFQREDPATACIYCGQKAQEMVYFAKSY
jgi:prolyl-tRNA synthetase